MAGEVRGCFAILKRRIRENLMEKVASNQRSGGMRGLSHGGIQEKSSKCKGHNLEADSEVGGIGDEREKTQGGVGKPE